MVEQNFWEMLRAKHDSLTKSGTIVADYLVQHADGDADFQRQVLDGIMPLVESGAADAYAAACLNSGVRASRSRLNTPHSWSPRR